MEIIEKKDGIVTNSLEDVLHNCMIPYAEYVIMDRALPRVEDGLKPVQRRILYSMFDQGMLPDKDFKKSARVVGDCLAKYHPHGDSSVYDAMVRLAQPFNMRAPLVQGHGNFGSIDGDSAAAMRYTEVKLQPLALELLRDIEKNTVEWDLNFDDSLQEPATLPGRYPNLLVNGSSGIAVGLATNIPPHNLAEVIDGACAVIDNPKIKIEELMKIIKGPDFPTGGFVVGGDSLKKAYETGKGKIIIQSKISVEQGDGDKKNIVITEMPYQTNKAALLRKISDLADKNKEILGGIADVCDESDRKGMRAVIKLKKDVDPDKIIAYLNKNTGLQVSFGINMVAIAGGKPRQMGLIEILTYYVDYQRNIIVRRTKYELDKAKERAHILEGLIIAVTNIDEVIQIIKKSPDTPTARQNLRKRFALTEKQAQAILDLRLARLTKLEVDNLKLELKELKERIEYLQKILDSKRLQMSIVKDEMREIKKKHREERRSVMVNSLEEVTFEKFDDVRPIEHFVVGMCANGLIRKIKASAYKRILSESAPNKKELFLFSCHVDTTQTILAFTNLGNCYKMDVELLPESKGQYAPGVRFDQLFKKAGNERPVAMFAIREGDPMPTGKIYFFTKMGYVKLSDWSEYGLLKQIFQATKLKAGDEVISVEEYRPNTNLFFATEKGMCLYADSEIPEQGRSAGGVKGMDVADNDRLIYATQVDDDFNGEILVATSFGTFKRVILGTINKLARARKGVKLVELGDGNAECVVFVKWLMGGEKVDFAILDRLGTISYSDSTKVVVENRTTKGKVIAEIGICQPERVYIIARQR